MIDALVAKAKGEMFKSLAKWHARSRGGTIRKGAKVFPSILLLSLALTMKIIWYHEDILNERLIKLKYKSYQIIYNIEIAVIKDKDKTSDKMK